LTAAAAGLLLSAVCVRGQEVSMDSGGRPATTPQHGAQQQTPSSSLTVGDFVDDVA